MASKDPSAAENHNGRQAAGTSTFRATDRMANSPGTKTTVKEGFGKADPLGQTGGAPVRKQSMGGASYRITAKYPAQSPEAANTTANGRTLKPTKGLSGNFYAQQLDAGVADAEPFPKGTWRP